MPRASTLEALADLTEEQEGLFTRRQAEQSGMAWTTLARLARSGLAERVAHGVYRLRGAPPSDQMELRAAWLQLAPDTPIWDRKADQGVVSHRSAAALHRLGHLPADEHHFILPLRRQSRRPDVRLHKARLRPSEWTRVQGILVTRPARIASDLLADLEDPQAVGHIVSDALQGAHDDKAAIVKTLSPYATKFGFDADDGRAIVDWLLELASGHRGRS
jgi:predicted transcriptional regulator of viral defense system